jgi:Fe2+ transport system protein FeoA
MKEDYFIALIVENSLTKDGQMDIFSSMPLKDLSVDNHATILNFKIGTAETTRLVSLGFTPGAEVCMTQNYGYGPLIVTVRGTRVALGRVEAAKIFVRRRPE